MHFNKNNLRLVVKEVHNSKSMNKFTLEFAITYKQSMSEM